MSQASKDWIEADNAMLAGIREQLRAFGKEKEQVNHPQHYGGDTTYETIKVLEAWLTQDEFRGWLKGTILKHLSRAGKKDASNLDFQKAQWYTNYLNDWLKRTSHATSNRTGSQDQTHGDTTTSVHSTGDSTDGSDLRPRRWDTPPVPESRTDTERQGTATRGDPQVGDAPHGAIQVEVNPQTPPTPRDFCEREHLFEPRGPDQKESHYCRYCYVGYQSFERQHRPWCATVTPSNKTVKTADQSVPEPPPPNPEITKTNTEKPAVYGISRFGKLPNSSIGDNPG